MIDNVLDKTVYEWLMNNTKTLGIRWYLLNPLNSINEFILSFYE